MGVVSDYAIYEYRVAGESAVERYAARSDATRGSDERVIIQATRAALRLAVGWR